MRPVWFLTLLAGVLAACAPTADPRVASPPLWRVSDGDTTLYLLGAIHLLPRDVAWQGGRTGAAIERADLLILEVANIADRRDQVARFRALSRANRPLPPLRDRVAPTLRPALAERLAALRGTNPGDLDTMKTWGAAVMLGATQAAALGATADAGVDTVLADRFAQAGKTITGLETADRQFEAFDGLSEEAQRHMLEQALRGGGDPAGGYGALLEAWSAGNDTAIATITARELSPELAQKLLFDRNARWRDQLATRMTRPGVVLVAVGAAHLAGPHGVPAMLAARGFRVERL